VPRTDRRVDEPRGAQADGREGRGRLLVALARALWRKGEQSGHVQKVRELRLDCDAAPCCYRWNRWPASLAIPAAKAASFENSENGSWVTTDPVRKDPAPSTRNEAGPL